jgi:hypothetical protein
VEKSLNKCDLIKNYSFFIFNFERIVAGGAHGFDNRLVDEKAKIS